MNYNPGRMPTTVNPNSMVYYAPVMQPPVNNPRVYNAPIPHQMPFVQQPYYPQQYSGSPTRPNRGAPYVNPFFSQPISQNSHQYPQSTIRSQTETFKPSQPYQSSNSPNKRVLGPSFNASVPMDYKKAYSNTPSHSSNSSHSNQHPSTFAMASNNMLRRSDVGLYAPGSTTSSQNGLLKSSTSNNTQFQTGTTHGNQLLTVSSQPGLARPNIASPIKNDRERHNDQLRDSLVRSGATIIDSPNRNRPGMSYNITATIIPLRGNSIPTSSPNRASSWVEGGHGPTSSRNRQGSHDPHMISLFNNHHHDHEELLPYIDGRERLTSARLAMRPAMVQVTFANPDLTNTTLTNLRNAFSNDESFGEELMRINEVINLMVGAPDGSTNWVATFIEQFFTQLNDQPKVKVLTDDDLQNLKTITFHAAKKKAKAKTDQGETDDGENLCAICLIDYEEGDTLNVLSCNHNFHTDCAGAWLKKKAECPTCRQAIEY